MRSRCKKICNENTNPSPPPCDNTLDFWFGYSAHDQADACPLVGNTFIKLDACYLAQPPLKNVFLKLWCTWSYTSCLIERVLRVDMHNQEGRSRYKFLFKLVFRSFFFLFFFFSNIFGDTLAATHALVQNTFQQIGCMWSCTSSFRNVFLKV